MTLTYNTAVGRGALEQNTIGEGNTAIGYASMGGTTNGKYNTAVGAFGGGDVFGGQRNVMLGYAAGFNLETGNDNVLIGANVSVNTLNGSKNIFIGTNAGATNVSGSSNTVIGYGANLSANNLTNATAIGANAYVSASNTISVGSINGVNGATSDTKVGFGTTAATERVHVNGNFRLVNGSQAAGRFLQSDANGVSTWADLPAASIPTWQQTLITGSNLTQDNTINASYHKFNIDSLNTFRMFSYGTEQNGGEGVNIKNEISFNDNANEAIELSSILSSMGNEYATNLHVGPANWSVTSDNYNEAKTASIGLDVGTYMWIDADSAHFIRPIAEADSGMQIATTGWVKKNMAASLLNVQDQLDNKGTVTNVSVVNTNGFSGTVSNPTTTPSITIQTTINGLLKGNGTAISAAVSGTDYLAPNAPIASATKTKITYGTDGRVTAGADATTADIAASSNKNYVTDAQQAVINNTSGINTGDQDLSGLQSLDADLTDISALAPANNDILQRKAGVWTNRTIAQYKADLSLNNVDNTSDLNKPISTATQTALDNKVTKGGDAGALTIGTNDATDLIFETNNTARVTIDGTTGYIRRGNGLAINGLQLYGTGAGATLAFGDNFGTDPYTSVGEYQGLDNDMFEGNGQKGSWLTTGPKGSTPNLGVTQNGSVCVGTMTPVAATKLTIVGATNISGNIIQTGNITQTGILDVTGNEAITGFTKYKQTTAPPSPANGTECHSYYRNNKYIIQYNDGGTVRYKYLDLTGTGVTWVHTTIAP
ncbi:MAG: hypothetical protein IPJ81_16025 [Chitinophagaceae bacterium]|nr:hypothetical protein [Chitinophagaceae bacterium]